MSDRTKTLIAVALIIVSLLLVIGPGLRHISASDSRYSASGREWSAGPIHVSSGIININTAEAALLENLPGIGETIAGLIVEERIAHGDYFYPEDLISVKGIGRNKLEKIRDMIGL